MLIFLVFFISINTSNCSTRPFDFVKKIVYVLIIPSNKNLKTFKKTPVRFVKGRATFFTWGLLIMSNSTTFLRVEKTKNYTVILNSLITSTDLLPEEKVILFHILSLPDDWEIYKEYFIKYYRGCISDDKIEKAWKGLKKKGYLKNERVKGKDGKFSSWHYEIREVPFTDIPKSDMSENQTIENSTSQEKGDIQSTNLISTNLQSTNSTNFNNTSIILGQENQTESKLKNKNNSKDEFTRIVNLEGLENLFSTTGINWKQEINDLPVQEFVSKHYQDIGDSTPDRLTFLITSYIELNNITPQIPQRG